MARLVIFFTLISFYPGKLSAWSEHPILARIALEDLPYWQMPDSVKVKSLYTFLVETEEELSVFLEFHEKWARENLEGYKQRPDKLAFKSSAGTYGIIERFYYAIRINPESFVPLYLYLMPGKNPGSNPLADPAAITMLNSFNTLYQPDYVLLDEGERVHPLDVLTTANNEPDYGFDTGLFEDNGTNYGAVYGFGMQPFGNPNIFYTSQVPFHMGFYHEDPVVYAFAPFLNQTYLEYRISLFRELSVFAFNNKQPYWGWRFLGWSMHYAGDASMPYHSKPLPGLSLWQMIWIGIKSLLGFHQSTHDAVQLVSNKHILLEEYQAQEICMAYLKRDVAHPFYLALKNHGTTYIYNCSFIRNRVSKDAADKSHKLDRAIIHNMPVYLTSNASLEISTLSQSRQIAHLMIEEKGAESIDDLNQAIAFHLHWFGITLRSLLFSVMEETDLIEQSKPEPYILANSRDPSHFLPAN
jgi:hypothetical protein